jgi:hypothetical protein
MHWFKFTYEALITDKLRIYKIIEMNGRTATYKLERVKTKGKTNEKNWKMGKEK